MPDTIDVEFPPEACLRLTNEEMVALAVEQFPTMRVFESFNGKKVWESRASNGTVRCCKVVCLFDDRPGNSFLEDGCMMTGDHYRFVRDRFEKIQ